MTDLSRIERAILTVASLIEQSGADYWPVLERLEAERDTLLSRQARLTAYLRQAGPARAQPRKGRTRQSTERGLPRSEPDDRASRPCHNAPGQGDARTDLSVYGRRLRPPASGLRKNA